MAPTASTLLNRFTVKAKFRHMQILVKLSELGSMRRAARAVNMTQPAISQQVAELEGLLETQLFFRHARGVKPTEATKELLPIAQRILSSLEDAAETVASRLNERSGIVRVSASPAAIGGILQTALIGFAERHEDVQVHVSQAGEADPLSALTDASADLICTREPSSVPEGWEFVPCIGDALVAVCGDTHPFALQKTTTMDNLGTGKWLQNRVGSVARVRFEETAQKWKWPTSTRCQIIMHIPELTRTMLKTNEYLALLPRSVALPWLQLGEVKELASELEMKLPPLGYLWEPRDSGPATQKLANFLKPDNV